MAADAVGYSTAMAADDFGTVAAIRSARDCFRRHVDAHGGRVVDTAGDSILAVFESASAAVGAALAVQAQLTPGDGAAQARLRFRIGIHVGDVVELPDGTVYGDGVNLAARREALAGPGGLAVSETVSQLVRGKVDVDFIDMGEQTVKGFETALKVLRVEPASQRPSPAIASAAASRSSFAESMPSTDRPSLAVMPFANLSGESSEDYFVDGVTEDITTDLARMGWLFVVAHGSASTLKGRSLMPAQVGRELGVRYLLDGSVRRDADRVRVTARLLDASNGRQLWAQRFDRALTDMFAVQQEIGELICGHVGLHIPEAELHRARQKHPASLDAWDSYLLAQACLREMTPQAHQRGVELLNRALTIEPGFALALAKLALAHLREAYYGWSASSTTSIDQAERLARQALQLDSHNATALEALASIRLRQGAMQEAAGFARRALSIDSTLTAAYGTLCSALAFSGRGDEALAVSEQCMRVSPRDPDRSSLLMGVANAHFVEARYAEALVAATAQVELRPNWYGGHAAMAVARAWLDDLAGARQAATRLLKLVPRFNLESAQRSPLFQRPSDRQRFIEGLRRAGVPESRADLDEGGSAA